MSTQNIPQTFEEAMAELELIVKKLEEGRLPLEESIKFFERGTKLRQYCEQKLMAAKLKVDQIQVDQQGQTEIEPFKTQAA